MSKPRILYRPKENGWQQHDGRDCPIHRDSIVRFQFANGKTSEKDYRAGDFIWRKRGWSFDIVAYRVVEAA
jgi:hypothetical protein